ncbi:hypothetical protein CPJCM30710_11180 [Clostridium polyendosporum]|uniref:Uncharacterized protein n=1 Tax=Clostridium polyendosporum TaxID=69208 RepID=A0A919RXT5_9CLOT|nr:hypothetical protein CPJCM30710_11180 [Clostridium polyendosporum]
MKRILLIPVRACGDSHAFLFYKLYFHIIVTLRSIYYIIYIIISNTNEVSFSEEISTVFI